MTLWELLLIAAGLSMDAFAVAVCKGLGMRRLSVRQALLIGGFFGGFQALMPLVGWLLARQFAAAIAAFDHWVAFCLLAVIGGNMIVDAAFDKEESAPFDRLCLRELTLLSLATSIDALAVGITLALLPDTDIVLSVSLIGAITFALSVVGVTVGNKYGRRFERKAAATGGVILILIGLKTLLEHIL